jgi:hypothetical protein
MKISSHASDGAAKVQRLYQWRRGENSFELLCEPPRLFRTRAVGAMTGTVMDGFIETLDELVASGSRGMIFFHDWYDLVSYEPSMRQRMTEWRRRAPMGTTHSIHILVRSKVIAMGVAASAVALRLAGLEIASYSSRTAFDCALRAAR